MQGISLEAKTKDSSKDEKDILKSNNFLLQMMISIKIQKMQQEIIEKDIQKSNLFYMIYILPSTS